MSGTELEPLNHQPYAAPKARIKRRPSPRGAWIKWAYLSAFLGIWSLAILIEVPGVKAAIPPHAAQRTAYTLLLALPVFGLLWLSFAWWSIPPRHRMGIGLEPISPLSAVLRLFVPVFGQFWAFAVQWKLCRGIEAASGRSAPWWLGMIAVTGPLGAMIAVRWSSIAAGCTLIASLLLGFVYMVSCDAARAHIPRPARGRKKGRSR